MAYSCVCRVQGAPQQFFFLVQIWVFRVQGSGFRIQGQEFLIWGSVFRFEGFDVTI